ncbi:MAG: NAD-dependent epimerase/dehydratase family protein [Mesorhizobium sp.]|uniref:NAD-dependent epimerase/dehydratase family protein n=1 Tax=Mesorhizobium sp. TaxID=1871066 RepID=UPI000FE3AEA1|nr:NAD-dependent epimerase/dehydratase family protein [Mesorhizobium sp.]RWJ04412.1 MAG: NAD-dependent epimerase/dehydratase family protein [Mesorhizobium sp.]RWJ15175.1 MAG: NAD-dependent epimerase/dehydratase family protein [Mesorhizobium sp.]
MELTGKRVVVIGGAGLIGSHTVDQLVCEQVSEIIVYDDFSHGKMHFLAEARKDKRVQIVNADVRDLDQLHRTLSGAHGVIHLATLLLLRCRADPMAGFEVNVRGTLNVMQACVDQGVERLVYASSTSVYGDAVEEPMTEAHPFNNQNLYGATKIASEALLHAYHHEYGLPYVAMRYMNVYGPRQGYSGVYMSVIMRMFDAAERGESPVIAGDGSEAYDLIIAEDVARANVCALRAGTVDRAYNIGTGVKTTLREIAENIRDLTGCNAPIRYTPRADAANLVRNRIGDTVRASAEIGFKSRIPLREGLQKLMEWRAANPWAIEARTGINTSTEAG